MDAEKIWEPTETVRERAQITHYMKWLQRERGFAFEDYNALWKWSVAELEAFWASIWEYFDVRASALYERVLVERRMPGAVWFPGAQLSYVDQVFRHATADSRPAIVFRSECGDRSTWAGWNSSDKSLHSPLRCGVRGWAAAIAWSPTCRTFRKRWSLSWQWPAWAPCGRYARPTWGRSRFSTGS